MIIRREATLADAVTRRPESRWEVGDGLLDRGVLPREELAELIELTVAAKRGAAGRTPPDEA